MGPSLQEFGRKTRTELEIMESSNHQHYNPWSLKKDLQCQTTGVTGGAAHLIEERHAAASHGVAMRADLPFPPVGGPIYQLYQDTDTFAGRRPVLGSWMVFGQASGMCVREDIQLTTDNDSCFTPHLVDLRATDELIVTQTQKAPDIPDVSGTYVLKGQLREAGVYFCRAKCLYLLRSPDDKWMFTAYEGGVDAYGTPAGVAIANNSSNAAAQPWDSGASGISWDFYCPKRNDWLGVQGSPAVAISRVAPMNAAIEAEKLLSREQATLRRELYGSAGGEIFSERGHRGGGGGGSYGLYRAPYYSSYRPPASGTAGHGAGATSSGGGAGFGAAHSGAARHGRKSANAAWKKYGTKAPTGTYGRSMGVAS